MRQITRWFNDFRNPRYTSLAATAVPDGLLQIKSAKALLGNSNRTARIQHIEQLSSFPKKHFDVLCLPVIDAVAEFLQELPASEHHHHAYIGGALDHALEVAETALQLRKAYLLPSGAEPEQIVKRQDKWTYAIFLGAILHDIGKPAVDQMVTLYDAHYKLIGSWNPWAQRAIANVERAEWYAVKYNPMRVHKFHERVAPMIAKELIPAAGMTWLTEDQEAFVALVSMLLGERSDAGLAGEIVAKADRDSTSRNLGANPVASIHAPTSKVSLIEKLTVAIRHLMAEGELPLNRAGAAGWLLDEDLWMVSKRLGDALRAHLLSEGHTDIPIQNGRLFDCLQDHSIVVTNGKQAVWRCTVSTPDKIWQHDLSLLRFKSDRIWANTSQRPSNFEGTICPISDETTDTPDVTQNDIQKSNEITHSTMICDAAVGSSAPPDEHNSSKVSSVVEISESEFAVPIAGTAESLGEQFLAWLRLGLVQRTIKINESGARVHVVNEGVLLVSPGIFKDYAKTRIDVTNYLHVQKTFCKLGLHLSAENGTNIHSYNITGHNKTSSVSGLLIQQRELVLGARNIGPNPALLALPIDAH
jgi:integrating conjugative element relaxase (TIGR03760 family)